MLPFKDEWNRPEHNAAAVKSLIAVNAAVFVVEIILIFTSANLECFNLFEFVPQKFYYIWTMVTCTFLHGGFFHLAGNMLFLWIFGDNVEDLLGAKNFVLFYFICAVAASATDGLFRWGSAIPSIGASGAISGVMGAYMRFFPKNKIVAWYFFGYKFGTFKIDAVWYLVFWFLGQLFYSIFGSGMGTAFGAHIGGFIAGYFIAGLFPLNQEALEYYQERAKRWW